eukprot:9673180-Lingulodinium_polyedra.AAC.1
MAAGLAADALSDLDEGTPCAMRASPVNDELAGPWESPRGDVPRARGGREPGSAWLPPAQSTPPPKTRR